jgi:glycoside/pentoside/hexuronide:cation symporter, GPH family
MRWTSLSLYALAESGIFAVEFFVRLQLLIYYTDKLKIESYLASIAAGAALIWDAFIDPYVGSFSDAFTGRWGNRKPFMLAGALLIPPALLWIFFPYVTGNQYFVFLQLLLASLLLNTGITLVTVPHAAISAELSREPSVRVRIFAARLLFANVGLIAGLIIPAVLLRYGREVGYDDMQIFPIIAIVIGLFCLVGVVVCILSLRTTQGATASDTERSFRNDLRGAVQNRFFVWLFVAGFLAYIGVAINSTLARYYYDHYLHLHEDQLAKVLIVFILVWSASTIFWVKLSDRYGKDLPAAAGIIALGLMTTFAYPNFQPESIMGPMLAAVAGGFFTGCILLFDSYVADAADLDFARTGKNREGFYFGIWKFGIKASRGVAVVFAGLLLAAIGYQAGSLPNEAVKRGIAILFGPVVGIIFIASGLVFYFFAAKQKRAVN